MSKRGWSCDAPIRSAAADALCRLAGDDALRRSLGTAAREHVLRHYTWERSLDLMIDAYRRVLDLHGGPGMTPFVLVAEACLA